MTDDSLTFGDVFEFNDKEYIFLAATSDVNYAAKILNIEDSSKLNNYCSKQVSKNVTRTDNMLFCYVMLTTDEIKDRAAQYGKPELEDYKVAFRKRPIVLNSQDLENLKKDILNTRATPIVLKEIVNKIDLKK